MIKKNIVLLATIFLLLLLIGGVVFLLYANPQKYKSAFLFQAYYYPKDINIAIIPNDYSGQFNVWAQNGVLTETVNVIKGLREGVLKGYYEDGGLRVEQHFINNKLNGEVKFYYDNGKIAFIGNYLNGLKEGWCNYYGAYAPVPFYEHWYKKGFNKVLYKNGKVIEKIKIEGRNNCNGSKNYKLMKLYFDEKEVFMDLNGLKNVK